MACLEIYKRGAEPKIYNIKVGIDCMGIISPFAQQGQSGLVFKGVLGGKAHSALAFAFPFLMIK